MGDYLTPEQIGDHLGVQPKTVRDWLRSGDLVGIKIGKSWRVHPNDLDRLLGERFFEARMARASRVHPNVEWQRGQCRACGVLMPEPTSNGQWVCSPECKGEFDRQVAAILGRGTQDFAMSCGNVVPQY
jgi:acetyl-CoA synthetase